MVRSATGMQCVKVSFLMPFSMERLGGLTGMQPVELLERHTLYPYLVAFTPPKRREYLISKALGSPSERKSLGVSARHGFGAGRLRRVCPHCIRDDLKQYGESYWRRAHLLPGVHVCVQHNAWLLTTPVSVQRGAGTDQLMPTDLVGTSFKIRSRHDTLYSFAVESLNALTLPPQLRDWLAEYRAVAVTLGYGIGSTQIDRMRFAEDVKTFFGLPFLAELHSDWDKTLKYPWPSRLLIPGNKASVSKHILLRTFLKHLSPASLPMRPPISDISKHDKPLSSPDSGLNICLRSEVRPVHQVSTKDIPNSTGDGRGACGICRAI
jgi:TniQ